MCHHRSVCRCYHIAPLDSPRCRAQLLHPEVEDNGDRHNEGDELV
jgi:hypothetical protein